MKKQKNYSFLIFIILVLSAVTVYFLQKNEIILPKLINNYFNDLVALPIVLIICLWSVRKLHNKPKFQLSFLQCLMLVLFYIVFFEVYLPKVNTRYTADAIDGGLYLIGGLLFYWWQRRIY
jgi:di/tricarboxylate transporter